MARLAFMTIGLLREPMGHPAVQGFMDRLTAVFDSAEGSPGFIDRWRRMPLESLEHSWGGYATPAHFQTIEDMRVPATLSLWEDIESVAAFAYRGAHGEAMSKRAEWFLPEESPGFVGWWVGDDHVPSFQEACERWTKLHKNGPTPFAFDFKKPFDESGEPYTIDRAKVKALGMLVQ